jgi:ParB-like chromosome segregation protein Spo0J
MAYEAHPLANIFPLMTEDKLQELADSIKKNGQQEPIVLFEGNILDGRNRYAACRLANVKAILTQYTGNDPVGFVKMKNLDRRDLTASQRAVAALELAEKMTEMEEKKKPNVSESKNTPDSPNVSDSLNKTGGTEQTKPDTTKTDTAKPDTAKQSDKANSPKASPSNIKKAAKTMNVGEQTVNKLKKIKETNPDALKDIASGKKTVSKVEEEQKFGEIDKKEESKAAVKKVADARLRGDALETAELAIDWLKKIEEQKNPFFDDALEYVVKWCTGRLRK